MNEIIKKKGIISKIAFQPPNPPSYRQSKNIIWLECQHSKKNIMIQVKLIMKKLKFQEFF